MKVTIVHTNNKKQLLVSTKTMEKLLQRIAKDDSRLTVTHFSLFPAESGLRPEGLRPARGVAASGFPPLRKIPHCCLP